MSTIEIKVVDVGTKDAVLMREELSDRLFQITGRTGKASFHEEEMKQSNAVFVVAYDGDIPCGCGAIRPRSSKVGEIKRIYSKRSGLGQRIVSYLEEKGRILGYQKIVLSTAKVNVKAVDFYHRIGYQVIENYEEYRTRTDDVCFEKIL